jgi:hypothetical protein
VDEILLPAAADVQRRLPIRIILAGVMEKPMKQMLYALTLAMFIGALASAQTPAPPRVDGGGGARATSLTRPPDSRRPRGSAVGLLGWKAGIRSDAFGGAIPFLDAAAKIDAAGVAFVEGVSTNLDYRLNAQELASIKNRLAELGLRVPAYRLDSIPADWAVRNCWSSPKRSRSN